MYEVVAANSPLERFSKYFRTSSASHRRFRFWFESGTGNPYEFTTLSTTNDALNAALTAWGNASKAANATYKSAATALGVAPVRPIQPTEPVKPAAPVKPVDPTKPVPPIKPAPTPKPSK